MDRVACIDVPALPLQLLLRRHPEWGESPVAVVDRDKPQGIVLWMNRRARRCGIRPGMRYGAALSLSGTLLAGEVSDRDVEGGIDFIAGHLFGFSPRVEPAHADPGVFWVDPSGFESLYRSLSRWAARLRSDLGGRGFLSRVAVGFSRFGAWAGAKAGMGRGVVVFESAGDEDARVRSVPLGSLSIAPELVEALGKFGVHTVGAFLDLPPGGVRERFGAEAHRLYEFAAGTFRPPFQSRGEEAPLLRTMSLESPETDVHRLLFVMKRLLDSLLAELASRHEALSGLYVTLGLEGGGCLRERIRPATATVDVRQIMNLVRLRFEPMDLGAGVEDVELLAESLRILPKQQGLFAVQPRRDPAAAERALARIRAEFGDGAVLRACLNDAHLPEDCFGWEPLERVVVPSPRKGNGKMLVRRIQDAPLPLPPRPRNDSDGWLLRGEEHGDVVDFVGPYVISGGWWDREAHREYHFAEMRNGEVFWVYYDRRRRHWFLQGRVE